MSPELAWEERSDWVNVRESVPKAMEDGVVDDTAATQATLDRIADGATVYSLPRTHLPGNQKHSKAPGRFLGVTLIWHGQATVLAWGGAAGCSGRPAACPTPGTSASPGRPREGGCRVRPRVLEDVRDGNPPAARGISQFHSGRHPRRPKNIHRDGRGVVTRTACSRPAARGVARERQHLGLHVRGAPVPPMRGRLFVGSGTNFYVRNSYFGRNAEADIVCRWERESSVRICLSLQGRSESLLRRIGDERGDLLGVVRGGDLKFPTKNGRAAEDVWNIRTPRGATCPPAMSDDEFGCRALRWT